MNIRQARAFSVLEETIQTFQLTPAEEEELEAARSLLFKFPPTQPKTLEDIALTTANTGVQYHLLNRPDLARFVVCNQSLDSRVVSSFLDHLVSTRRGSSYIAYIPTFRLLLSHKVIVSNVDLFKRTWEVSMIINPRPLTSSREAKAGFDALDSNSVASGAGENAMSIETLLFIMAHLRDRDEKYEINPYLDHARRQALEARESEIKAWIQDNMPDYVGLPLSWVLNVYDLH